MRLDLSLDQSYAIGCGCNLQCQVSSMDMLHSKERVDSLEDFTRERKEDPSVRLNTMNGDSSADLQVLSQEITNFHADSRYYPIRFHDQPTHINENRQSSNTRASCAAQASVATAVGSEEGYTVDLPDCWVSLPRHTRVLGSHCLRQSTLSVYSVIQDDLGRPPASVSGGQ